MKLLKIVFALILATTVFAGKAQEQKGIPEVGCPPGQHPIISFVIDVLNFHRPKYNCERGFFICVRTHFEIDCTPDRSIFQPFFKDGKVQGYGVLLDGKMELHLPAALADLDEYAEDDMSVFSVEKDWVDIYFQEKKVGTMKEGDYEVTRVGEELVITVDLE
jgi:hypothetical protein